MTPVEWAIIAVIALVVLALVLALVDTETLLELGTELID